MRHYLLVLIIVITIFKIFNVKLKYTEIPKNSIMYHVTKKDNNIRYDNRYTYFSDNYDYFHRVKSNYNKYKGVLIANCKYDEISTLTKIGDIKSICHKIKILKFVTKRKLTLLEVSHENVILFYKNKINKLNINGMVTNNNHIFTKNKIFYIRVNPSNFYSCSEIKEKKLDIKPKSRGSLVYLIKEFICNNIFDIMYLNRINSKLNNLDIYHNTNYSFYKKQNNNFRICSYNVHYWKDCFNNLNTNNIIKNIFSSNFDIVCLQEAPLNNVIKKTFKNYYIYYYGQLAVISRYKIINHYYLDLGRDPKYFFKRYCLVTTIQIRNKKINIFNTHLDVYDNSERLRLKQIKIVLNEIDSYPSSFNILAGDLNSLKIEDYTIDYYNEIKKKPQYLPKKYLVIPLLEKLLFDTKNLDRNTDKMKNLITTWCLKKVDYIYINKKLNTKFGIISDTSSDHFLIYSDITIF